MAENGNSTLRVDDIRRFAQDDPEVARKNAAALAEAAPERAAAGSPGAQTNLALLRLEKYATDDVQKAIVAQINVLDTYYNTALGQAKQSFKWALISAAIGLAFFPCGCRSSASATIPITRTAT
jgi:hypothetical protein